MDRVTHMIFWVLTILSPVNAVMITIVFLIVVDFITGSYASYKSKVPISSERIGNTISKFFIYNLVILASYFMEEHIVDEIPFLKIIAGFIALTEIKSIMENFNKIYGVNPFKALINLLKKSELKDAIESMSKDQKTK
ncbi:phage holin family protein [Aquimarina hainanensis]|uniref:Phage holin family protein n=1 Tax=Aquimarina hainanensis TaxID=1578017 RepID=A0ABW5NAA0_9FLAO|nr:phage holin family protein [Aquimarina sp. TRL1]QKX05509.1 hypothetical protein HN014_11475 [Aquimarina sp. TRL1]